MSYEDKIARVRAILEAHNGQTQVAQINIIELIDHLKREGGTNEESLRLCTWEDLQRMGLPLLLARQVAAVFRAAGEPVRQLKFITAIRAATMSDEDLLKNYDPRQPLQPVAESLETRSKGKRFIVFDDDGAVLIEASAKLLAEIRDGHDSRDTYMVDGRPRKTYKVGERPNHLADENPLYPGRVLRPDGTCDQTNRSWEGVSYEVRALIYIARTRTNEVSISSLDAAHGILDLAVAENALTKLRERYPRASVMFDEMKTLGQLPALKLSLSGVGRTENPFGRGNRTF